MMTVPLNSAAEFRWMITSGGAALTGLVGVPVNVYGQDGSGTPIDSGTLTEIAEGLYRFELSSSFTATAGRLSAVPDLSGYSGVEVSALCDEVCVLPVGNVTSINGSAASASAISLLLDGAFSCTISGFNGAVLTLATSNLPNAGWIAKNIATNERRVVTGAEVSGGGPTYTATLDRAFNTDPTGQTVAFVPALLAGMGEGDTGLTPALLDVLVSSRLAALSYTAPDNAAIGTINTKLGTPAASVSEDIAAVKTDTGAIGAIVAAIGTALTGVSDRIGAFTGSGVNTVLGFLKAMFSSSASTPSDLGGTGTAANNSLQAIRAHGDAAWVTGATAADVQVNVTPYVASVSNPRYTTKDIKPIPAGSAPSDYWIIVDATGGPVDLSGKTVRLIVAELTDDNEEDTRLDDEFRGLWKYETGGNGITISGTSNNRVTVQHSNTHATPGVYWYWLYDVTDEQVLAKGKLTIEPAVLDI